MHGTFRISGLMAGMLAMVSGVSIAGPILADDTSMLIPVDKLEFYRNKQGFTIANGWGDPATGPHSNYIKMPGGAKSGLHKHSFSYYGVVIAGVVENEASDGAAVHPLRAGSYWFQKGGEPHVTNCLSNVECLIFVTSKGPFDFQQVGKPSSPRSPGMEG